MHKPLYQSGRLIGMYTGAVLSLLWAYVMWFPEAGLPSLAGAGFAVSLLMCFLAIIAALASRHGHSALLMIAFLASFLPVGAVLLRVDVWLRWIGVLDLLLLLATTLIWFARRGAPMTSR